MLLDLAWDVGGVCLKAGDRETAQSLDIRSFVDIEGAAYSTRQPQYLNENSQKDKDEEAGTGIVMYWKT
jgi:hypothetical protein